MSQQVAEEIIVDFVWQHLIKSIRIFLKYYGNVTNIDIIIFNLKTEKHKFSLERICYLKQKSQQNSSRVLFENAMTLSNVLKYILSSIIKQSKISGTCIYNQQSG